MDNSNKKKVKKTPQNISSSKKHSRNPGTLQKSPQEKSQKDNDSILKFGSAMNIKEPKIPSKPNLPKSWITEGTKSHKKWAKESKKGQNYVRCVFCEEDILVESCYGEHCHQTTKKHLEKEEKWRKDNPKEEEEVKEESKRIQDENLEKERAILTFEYNLIQFIAKMNCPIQLGEQFIQFLKSNIPLSEFVNVANVTRQKSSLILNHCIKPVIKEEIESKLTSSFFSLIIDEGTDKMKTKHLALIVQFWGDKGPECTLYSLINCSDKQESNAIFEIINEEILKKPYGKNLVAFASDGASVMRAPKNSVVQKLKEKNPHIWDIHCLAHCFNLISGFAADCLPDSVEQLVKQLYNHFAHSSLRISQWLELQEYMNLKPYKLLRWCETRWSSLKEAVCRILVRWDPLLDYFTNINSNSDSQFILKKLKKAPNKLYLQFLQIFLGKIDAINKHFQNQFAQIALTESVIGNFFETVVNILLKPEFKKLSLSEKLGLVQRNKELNLFTIHEDYIKNIEELTIHFQEIYGGAIEFQLIEDRNILKNIIEDFKKFLLRLLFKAQKVLPFNNDLLSKIKCLNPKEFDENTFLSLAKNYPNIIPPTKFFKLYEEIQLWEKNIQAIQDIFEIHNEDIISFYKDPRITKPYEELVLFAKTLLIFPHSSAEAERIFSQMNCIKSVKRSNLHDETLESLLMVKYNQLDFSNQELMERVDYKYRETLKNNNEEKKGKEIKRKSSQISRSSSIKNNLIVAESKTEGLDLGFFKKQKMNDQRLMQEKQETSVDINLPRKRESSETFVNEEFIIDDEIHNLSGLFDQNSI